MSHSREVCRTHGTIKSQCRCPGNKTVTEVDCGEWCSEWDATKADFTRDELALIRAACLTANPRYPDTPMFEPWASIFEKAGKAMTALRDLEEWRSVHAMCSQYRSCVALVEYAPCK